VKKKASYKLWLYALVNKNMEHQLSFLWCEKGVPPVNSICCDVNTPLFLDIYEPMDLETIPELPVDIEAGGEITIDDLSFLKNFVSPKVAAEFGW